jgi:hypothetical protein
VRDLDYDSPMRWIADTLGGLYELLRLGVLTRFRFSGSYWTWRMHTAFGRGMPGKRETRHAVLDYGRWMHRMRRGT